MSFPIASADAVLGEETAFAIRIEGINAVSGEETAMLFLFAILHCEGVRFENFRFASSLPQLRCVYPLTGRGRPRFSNLTPSPLRNLLNIIVDFPGEKRVLRHISC